MYYRQYYSLIIYQIHIASADEADALSTLATAAAATPCALLLLLLRIRSCFCLHINRQWSGGRLQNNA